MKLFLIFIVMTTFLPQHFSISCSKNLQDPLPSSIKALPQIANESSIKFKKNPYLQNVYLHKFSKEFSDREVAKIHEVFQTIRVLVNTKEFLQKIEENFDNMVKAPPLAQVHSYLEGADFSGIFLFLERLKTIHINLHVCKQGIEDIKTYNSEDIVWLRKKMDILQEQNMETLLLNLFSEILRQLKSSPLDDELIRQLVKVLAKIILPRGQTML